MAIANIKPTSYPLTSLNRSLEKATVTMFHEEDLRLDIEDFKIAVVYNGTDHYVGTKPVQKNFKDGILAYSNYLQEVQVIGDLLIQCTKDETVSSIISKCNTIVNLADKKLVKLFTLNEKEKEPEEHADATFTEGGQGEIVKPKKKSVRLETVQKPSSWTKLHCVCGITKATEEEVFNRRTNRHIETNSWICGYKDCKVKYTSSGSLKNHVTRSHFQEFLHYCKYCEYVNNTKDLVYSHLVANHGAKKEFECGEHNLTPGCGGKFASVLHLRKHQPTCGVKEKQHICAICQKGYMKKESLVHHIKVIHNQGKDKLQCNWCGKTYQSEHSYKNHYKSNCIKRYEEEEEITPEVMLEAEIMVRAQAQSLIQGLNTQIPTKFPHGEESVMELS